MDINFVFGKGLSEIHWQTPEATKSEMLRHCAPTNLNDAFS